MSERAGDEVRVIDPRNGAYTWDGWGTCLSWWAGTELGARDDLAAALFGLANAKVGMGREVELPGLGLNIVRYNLGACTWTDGPNGPARPNGPNGPNGPAGRMVESPAIVRRKQIEGFWNGGEWDWNADADQRNMLAKARDAGADTFEMFSVSPLWWMTLNGNPSGAEDGSQDNLDPAQREAFARYIAEVVRRARDAWEVRFGSVDPFNEPSLTAWHAKQNQEGCHFGMEAQQEVIECLRRALDGNDLGDVLIAASDECLYTQAADTWWGLPATTKRLVGRVNVHGYERDEDSSCRAGLRRAVGEDMPVWQTEYSEGEPDGLTMALNIGRDIRHLRVRGWVCWQAVEALDWGLLDGEYDDATANPDGGAKGTLKGEVGGVNTKYYVLAHFTRHIRPAARILDSGHANTVAAHDASARRLALVTTNSGRPLSVTYDLSRFDAHDNAVRIWTTDAIDARRARRYQRQPDTRLRGRLLTLTHAADTVTTLEIDGIAPVSA